MGGFISPCRDSGPRFPEIWERASLDVIVGSQILILQQASHNNKNGFLFVKWVLTRESDRHPHNSEEQCSAVGADEESKTVGSCAEEGMADVDDDEGPHHNSTQWQTKPTLLHLT